jgi:DNA-binding MarR family transcriptional regulator
MPPLRDPIDRVIESWARTRPDLDVAPIGIVSRIALLRSRLATSLDAVFSRFGLREPEFAVLATLVRLGGRAPQRQLVAALGLTPGTVSIRVGSLVDGGLVEREPDPDDGRGAVVSLTEAGQRAFDACAPEHLANERCLLAGLTEEEQTALAGLLRKLLLSFEPDAHVSGALGLSLAPAHEAAELRRAVGLPARAGLLVRDVAGGGPAAAAGLERGDLLVEADGRPLASIADLCAVVDAAERRRRNRVLALGVVRGSRRRVERLQLSPPARPVAPRS